MRSATSDPFRILLPVLFGIAGGAITATKQGWWGLLAASVIAAAVHGSMWLAATVLAREAEREAAPAPTAQSSTEHDYFVRCLRAVRTLPPHKTDMSRELNDLLLVVEQARSTRNQDLLAKRMDTLRKTAEQLGNIDATASLDQIEHRLRLIKRSLRNILDGHGEETVL